MADAAHTTTAGKSPRLAARARRAAKTDDRRYVSFSELVKVHHLREAALEGGEIYSGEAEERYYKDRDVRRLAPTVATERI